jgi:hypothetical protein
MGSLADAIFLMLKPSDYNRHPGISLKLRIYLAGHTAGTHAMRIQLPRLADLALILRGPGDQSFQVIKISEPSQARKFVLRY